MLWAIAVCCTISLVLLITLSVGISHVSSFDPKQIDASANNDEPQTGRLLPPIDGLYDAVCTFGNLLAITSTCGNVHVFKFGKDKHVRELGGGHPIPFAPTAKLAVGRDVVVAWCQDYMWVFRVSVSGLQLALKCEPQPNLGGFIGVQIQANLLIVQHQAGNISTTTLDTKKGRSVAPAEMSVNTISAPVVGLIRGGALAVVQKQTCLSVWEIATNTLCKIPHSISSTNFCCLQNQPEVFYTCGATRVAAFDPKLNSLRSFQVASDDQVITSLKALEPYHIIATCNTGHLYCLDIRTDSPSLVVRDVASDGSCIALSNAAGDLFVGHLSGKHADFCIPRVLVKTVSKSVSNSVSKGATENGNQVVAPPVQDLTDASVVFDEVEIAVPTATQGEIQSGNANPSVESNAGAEQSAEPSAESNAELIDKFTGKDDNEKQCGDGSGDGESDGDDDDGGGDNEDREQDWVLTTHPTTSDNCGCLSQSDTQDRHQNAEEDEDEILLCARLIVYALQELAAVVENDFDDELNNGQMTNTATNEERIRSNTPINSPTDAGSDGSDVPPLVHGDENENEVDENATNEEELNGQDIFIQADTILIPALQPTNANAQLQLDDFQNSAEPTDLYDVDESEIAQQQNENQAAIDAYETDANHVIELHSHLETCMAFAALGWRVDCNHDSD